MRVKLTAKMKHQEWGLNSGQWVDSELKLGGLRRVKLEKLHGEKITRLSGTLYPIAQ